MSYVVLILTYKFSNDYVIVTTQIPLDQEIILIDNFN